MKLIFCLQINTKFFYSELIVPIWICVNKHAQNTKTSKFAKSLQYLKENVKDEVDFLPKDKDQRLLQIDTITLGVCGQGSTNYPK